MLKTTVMGALLLLGVIVCSSQLTLADDLPSRSFATWQVLNGHTGQPIGFDEWLALLSQQDVIYLGEEHRNHWHIEAALRILRTMMDRGQRPVLAMEMFGWDGQPALTQYMQDPAMTREQFVKSSRWEQNWGGTFQDYEPLVAFARQQRLPLLALNPPRPLVRKVATQGLAKSMDDPDMTVWQMKDEPLVDDAAYRNVIVGQLERCHGGLPQGAYEAMYEASMFRDEGMAKTIRESLRRGRESGAQRGPIVSYTGGGHIQYNLPIPNRVLRKAPEGLKQTTVYITSFTPAHPEEIEALLRDAIADYVWLTPVGANGPAKRCR